MKSLTILLVIFLGNFATMESINTSSPMAKSNNGNFMDEMARSYINFNAIDVFHIPIPKKTIQSKEEAHWRISSNNLMELNSMDNYKPSELINRKNLLDPAYLKSYEFVYFLINLVKYNDRFYDNNHMSLTDFPMFKQNPIHKFFLSLNCNRSNILDMTFVNKFLKNALFSDNNIAYDSVFQVNFSMKDQQQIHKLNGNITDSINLAIISTYKETNPTHRANEFHNIKCFKNFDEIIKFAILELAIFYKINWSLFMDAPIIKNNGNLKNCLAKGDEGFVIDYFKFRLNGNHTTRDVFNNFFINFKIDPSNPENSLICHQNCVENLGNSAGMLKTLVSYLNRAVGNFNNLDLLFVSIESEALENLQSFEGCPLALMPFPTGPFFDEEKEIHTNLHRFHVLYFSRSMESGFFANQLLEINDHLKKLTYFVKKIKTIIKRNPNNVCEINLHKRDRRRTLEVNKIGNEKKKAQKYAVKAQKAFFKARKHLIRDVIEKFLDMAGKEYNEIYNTNILDHKNFAKKFIYHLTEMIKPTGIKSLKISGAHYHLPSDRKQIYSRCFGYFVNEFPFVENKFKDMKVTSLYRSIVKYKDFSKCFSFIVNGDFLLNVSNYGENQWAVPQELQYNKSRPKTDKKLPRKKVAVPIPMKIQGQ